MEKHEIETTILQVEGIERIFNEVIIKNLEKWDNDKYNDMIKNINVMIIVLNEFKNDLKEEL